MNDKELYEDLHDVVDLVLGCDEETEMAIEKAEAIAESTGVDAVSVLKESGEFPIDIEEEVEMEEYDEETDDAVGLVEEDAEAYREAYCECEVDDDLDDEIIDAVIDTDPDADGIAADDDDMDDFYD